MYSSMVEPTKLTLFTAISNKLSTATFNRHYHIKKPAVSPLHATNSANKQSVTWVAVQTVHE